jgi:GntR family transcriptional regulator, vanillate catabolism transcriptional regulator
LGTEHLSQLDKAIMGLRSLVMGGEFLQGQRLSEVAVSERLGLSRTPLRQAMDRLVAEGLLERIETGGCRIATFTIQDIADAIDLRGLIEGAAARKAAEQGGDPCLLAQAMDALSQIDQALSAEEGANFDRYLQQNERFHNVLAQLSGSALLIREVARVVMLPLASPSAFLIDQAIIPDFQDSLRYAQRQHRAIVEAIINREGARAEAITREHARLALINLKYLSAQKNMLPQLLPGMGLVART